MNKILKYTLKPVDGFDAKSGWTVDVDLPQGAQPLSVIEQFGAPRLYAIADPEGEVQPRRIALVHTGAELPAEALTFAGFLGTVPLQDGGYVVHAFDLGPAAFFEPEVSETPIGETIDGGAEEVDATA